MRSEGSLTRAVAKLNASAMSAVEQPIGGMFRLIEELVYRLEEDGADLRAAASVTSVRRTTHGLQVHTHDGEDLSADKLVLATPAAVAARLLGGLGQEIQAPAVGKLRMVVAAATTPALKEHPVGTGVLVAAKDSVRCKALTNYSVKWPWAAETGLEVMRIAYPEHVFPTRAEVLSDVSRLTGVRISDSELVGLASIGWDALPTRVEAANRDYLVGLAARVGADVVGAWLDGNGISNVMAGIHRVIA
nr:FAD-dependent oxidoreductase [Tessaracoccus coleopterorum]